MRSSYREERYARVRRLQYMLKKFVPIWREYHRMDSELTLFGAHLSHTSNSINSGASVWAHIISSLIDRNQLNGCKRNSSVLIPVGKLVFETFAITAIQSPFRHYGSTTVQTDAQFLFAVSYRTPYSDHLDNKKHTTRTF